MKGTTPSFRSTREPPFPFSGNYRREVEVAVEAAVAAGQVVLRIYDGQTFGEYSKVDGSPVTDADLAADRVIRSILQEAFPSDALLTEEGQDDGRRLHASRCWIVDPIDGTEQFIRRTGEFDVLVALVKDCRPVVAAGYQPTTSTLVVAEKGRGAWVSRGGDTFTPLAFDNPSFPVRICSSKWFGAPENAQVIAAIAARVDSAEVFEASEIGFTPRMFLEPRAIDGMIGIRTEVEQDFASEWDFAVADLAINEAGGVVTDLAGMPFQYNKQRPVNVGGLVASVSPDVHGKLLAAIRAVKPDL